ncbi:MAG: glycoside hydrolase family 5 protein [Treponema sp.]|jgi:endoglucanase|nr:glycoside hydrolase family 5 protein [Treponema sp.]
MKKFLYMIFLIGTLFPSCNSTNRSNNEYDEPLAPEAALRKTPFSRGVNFSGWFEAGNAHSIPFTKYIEQDFIELKSLGADHIRLPVRMHDMTSGPPDYTLDPLLLKFLDTAVEWAEKHGLYIIIDNHSFDPQIDTQTSIENILLPVWAQIAERYKNRSDYVVYEILNEPHGISGRNWGEIQGKAIEAIRKTDQKHAVMVGGTDWNSINALAGLPAYEDHNLIYTFHFYDPFLFTHQGASWGDPLLVHLEGVPFPYDKSRMPSLPPALDGNWIKNSLEHSYQKDSLPETLYASLDKAVAFSRERDVPVFCGEFGVYLIQSPNKDRVRWYEIVSRALDRRNISRASWDYSGGFGIFNTQNGGDFNSDLNTGVVRAMGFTPPPQKPKKTEPVKSGFTIFDDFPARGYSVGYWGEGEFSMYDVSSYKGEYAIRWSDAAQYNAIWINFNGSGDFSFLADAGYFLEFAARTEKPVSFDIRFLNPENASSIPWRIKHTVDEKALPPDGSWHNIRIPLKMMQEHGAWVSKTQEWIGPQGKFNWKNIEQMQIVPEEGNLKNRTVWLDEIKITAP